MKDFLFMLALAAIALLASGCMTLEQFNAPTTMTRLVPSGSGYIVLPPRRTGEGGIKGGWGD